MPVEKRLPLILILSFMDPINLRLSSPRIGVTLATGRPLLVIMIPGGSSSSKIFKHLALNSLAVIVFSAVFIVSMISDDQSFDQSFSCIMISNQQANGGLAPLSTRAWKGPTD